MTATMLPGPVVDPIESPVATTLEIVVPVHNEQDDLAASVRRLHGYLGERFPFEATVTIADNASTDRTWAIALELVAELPGVRAVHLAEKGRGRALRHVWSRSSASVVAYMDVDLSTDLDALLPLVAPLLSGHSDLAIGSRLSSSSRVTRGPQRELVSRSYNLLLRGVLGARFSDAQCGFKAVRRDVAQRLLPLVRDETWFFDTELLVIAERAGLRIHEVPVDWVDDPDSRVDVVRTAIDDLRGTARLARGLAAGRIPLDEVRGPGARAQRPLPGVVQALRFAAIGVLSTLAYALVFWLLRQGTGAQVANLLALLVTTLGNTAANRRLTFSVRGRSGLLRHHAQGLVVLGLALALTSGSLLVLHAGSDPGHALELVVLTVANLVATVLRFVLLRSWVFASATPADSPDHHWSTR
ncbi:Undecaprenyl-phosphate mannosyltransferase [Nocardioides dokdonensis FR1436]|uniref:dolichyl-phosphate beta-glucosyltransferase n=1 Tax=Nocardioides dokdonensis FR1436 TaxID=1300347 RepID=A0A1A9GQ71_9ACTN|nr:bifunctional glycosyltransferase family 2/GtrA family protein [Nocardioides dokdonensis]ANH40449.1 Undecaprenyl-phosphate mannosyltransferase [Nocardioides dokdonensis FR1436]